MVNYLITGASGYIGSLVIKELINKAKRSGEAIRVIAVLRDAKKAKKVFPEELSKSRSEENVELIFAEADITDAEAMNRIAMGTLSVDYIIHCAAPTTSAYMISNPVETADGIVLGTRNVLEIAKRQQVKSMVYLSSMEVYGRVSDIGRMRKEDELGEIDLTSPRSCYPLGKRMAEHYCHIYAKEYGVPVKIARLAQTFGVGVRPEDNRVYMQFARAAYEKKDIILKTQGLSVGNYCAADDAVTAILLLLERGADGEAYNVVNEANTMCIRDMAALVAENIAGGEIAVRIEVEDSAKTGYAPDTQLRLSGEKLRNLGWEPVKGLPEMYRDVMSALL